MRFEPRPITYTIGCNLFRAYFRLFHNLKVYGRELCPGSGPVMIVANHCSHLDPPLISVAYRHRRVRFMAKVELWSGWFLSWYLSSIGTIPVERGSGGKEAIEKSVEVLKNGGCLGMYPEGTRSRTGEPGRGRSGPIVIASQAKPLLLLPVYIEGTFESFPAGAKKVTRHPIKVYTGEPFELSEEQCELTERGRMRETANMIMEKIVAARQKYVASEADAEPEDGR